MRVTAPKENESRKGGKGEKKKNVARLAFVLSHNGARQLRSLRKPSPAIWHRAGPLMGGPGAPADSQSHRGNQADDLPTLSHLN